MRKITLITNYIARFVGGKAMAIIMKDLPLGFGMALAQQPEAMQRFSNMSDTQKSEILSEVHNIKSKEEMKSFVENLAR